MKISSCVFQGSVLPMSSKIEVILGTTTTMSIAHDDRPQDHHDDRVGQRAGDLRPQRVLRVEEVGQARQHRVQVAGRLARADHVGVELREDRRVRGQRVGQRAPLVDLLPDLGQHALELLVVGLLGQRAQRLGQRDARLEQRRELAGERRHLLRLHPLEHRLEVDLALEEPRPFDAAAARAAARWPPASTSRCSVMKTPSLRSVWRSALGPSASRVPVTALPAVLSPFQL